ncbi:O-antigen ligase family protein [Effusibacillus consociatus]|uniref:O-antigen ligase family protein n=1 Tax=Effusibacillus consociatus TaxID=1117041 RepID=A0ABV9Q8V6_9BACL
MTITAIGWILIPVSLLLFLMAPRWLYILMVFFIPFSATAVANFESASSGSGLQIAMFCGFLWIVSVLLQTIKSGNIKVPALQSFSIILLMAFMTIVLVSLIMPIMIDGDLLVESANLYSSEVTALTFTSRHITQTLYLAYGIIITILVATKNTQLSQFVSSLKAYVLSGIFVSLWGWLQFIFDKIDIPYPYFIFNNNINPAAQGFTGEFLDLNLKRISSVAVEPSILSQFLLTVVPIVLVAVLTKRTILSPFLDRFSLVIMSSILILSTAATAYIGLLVMLFVILLISFRLKFRLLRIWGIISLTLVCGVIYLVTPKVQILTSNLLFDKLNTGSGLERLASIETAWEYFLDYPFLGVGWGSVTSHDLIVNILVNTGILGLVLFIMMTWYILNRLLLSIKRYNNGTKSDGIMCWAGALAASLITCLFINVLTGFTYVFGHIWFIFGMTIAATSIIDVNAYKSNKLTK